MKLCRSYALVITVDEEHDRGAQQQVHTLLETLVKRANVEANDITAYIDDAYSDEIPDTDMDN